MNESVIDFPKDGLCKDIWSEDSDGNWKLRPEVRRKLLALHRLICPEADTVRVIGSITSNSYVDTADIDLHFTDSRRSFKNDEHLERY